MFESILLDLLVLAAVFYAGYRIGRTSVAVNMARNFVENPEKMRQMMREIEQVTRDAKLEELGATKHDVEVVVEKGQYYLFRKSNNQFLAQGLTLKEALDRVKERFPGETFVGHIERREAEALGLVERKD